MYFNYFTSEGAVASADHIDDTLASTSSAPSARVSKSRVAKQPIAVPAGVNIELSKADISVKGPKGELKFIFPVGVDVVYANNIITVVESQDISRLVMMAGTTRSIVNSMVIGVFSGFTISLQLVGVGYKCSVTGNELTLNLGYSHPVKYTLKESIFASCATNTEIVLSSCDKRLIGMTAKEIQSFREPNSYSGKGVQIKGETLILKEKKKGGQKK